MTGKEVTAEDKSDIHISVKVKSKMTGEEEKFSPNFGKMEMGEIQGAAKAAKNMADQRFKKFKADIQEVIEAGMFNKDNYQLVKDLKKDVEENIVKYEDILTYLEGVYSAKPDKFKAEITELTKNFQVMAGRRSTVRIKGQKAIKAIEDEKNKQEQTRSREDRTVTGSQRGGGSGGDKQFKQPTGAHHDRISSEFTPLMAKN